MKITTAHLLYHPTLWGSTSGALLSGPKGKETITNRKAAQGCTWAYSKSTTPRHSLTTFDVLQRALSCAKKRREKSTPLGVMTGASVPRSSPRLAQTCMRAGGGFVRRHGGTEPDDVAAGVLEHPARSVCSGGRHSSPGWRLQIIHIPGEH